jgi:hypothetical protein
VVLHEIFPVKDFFCYGSETPHPNPARSFPPFFDTGAWMKYCMGPNSTIFLLKKFWLRWDLNPGLPVEKLVLFPLFHKLTLTGNKSFILLVTYWSILLQI